LINQLNKRLFSSSSSVIGQFFTA